MQSGGKNTPGSLVDRAEWAEPEDQDGQYLADEAKSRGGLMARVLEAGKNLDLYPERAVKGFQEGTWSAFSFRRTVCCLEAGWGGREDRSSRDHLETTALMQARDGESPRPTGPGEGAPGHGSPRLRHCCPEATHDSTHLCFFHHL